MRVGFAFLFAIVSGMAQAAELVNFGPAFCEPDMLRIDGECVARERGRCNAGYYVANIADTTYSAISLRMRCMNTYNEVDLPDFFDPIYNGVLVDFGPTFCGENQIMVDGKCERRTQGRCPDDFYQTPIAQNTFAAMTVGGEMCMNTYAMYEMPDFFSAIYNGVLVDFGPTFCGAGMRYIDGGCVPASRGDCPTGFYDVTADDATLVKTTDGACEKGYSLYGMGINCASRPGDASMCAILCDDGTLYTGFGTCAAGCTGARAIRTSTGVTIPLYAERQSSPTLNVETSGGAVCYGNMMPGVDKGAINIKYNDTTYHLTD